MNINEIKQHNMQYLGLNNAQYKRHVYLMKTNMNKWPKKLYQHVVKVCQEVGMCGDVISCAVADWLKADNEHST